MTRTAERLINAFDEAAGSWAWQRSEGWRSDSIEAARLRYEEARAKLTKYVEVLQDRAKAAQ